MQIKFDQKTDYFWTIYQGFWNKERKPWKVLRENSILVLTFFYFCICIFKSTRWFVVAGHHNTRCIVGSLYIKCAFRKNSKTAIRGRFGTVIVGISLGYYCFMHFKWIPNSSYLLSYPSKCTINVAVAWRLYWVRNYWSQRFACH